jgi:ABC-type branched-subunit amino acid transport system substrate-binding protein
MRSNRIRALLACTLSIISLSASRCSLAENKIGVILPMTGDFARYGEMVREGLESEKLSSIGYVYENEGCDPRVAVSAFHKLHSFDKANVFLGPWCGSPQVAVASQLAKFDGLAILGSSAPERVYQLSSGRMLAVQPSIEKESSFNAQEAYRIGARKVVIVFLENDFSRAHEAAFREEFKGEVLDTLAYSSPDGSALRGIATKIKQLAPDTLYIPDAFPLMHGLIKNLGAVGARGLRLMSVYSAQSADVLEVVGSGGEGLIYSYPDIPDEALHHFPRLAAQVLSHALQSCPNQNPECMKRAIRERYSFDEHGVLPGNVRLKTIRNGMFVWY